MRRCLFLAAAVVSTALGAAPSPPTSASFVPGIGYTYASGNSTDLRLTDEAGSTAILVFRQGNPIAFDLSPRATHRIAYVASTGIGGSNASLQYKTWDDSTGKVTLSAATTVFNAARSVRGLDFSPDGGRLAFGSDETTDTKLEIYDFANPGAAPTPILSGYRVWALRWRSDGLAIYFTGYPAGSNGPMKVYQIAPDGTGLTALFDVAPGTNPPFDTSRPSSLGFEKILINYRPSNLEPVYLRAYNRDGTFNQLGTGLNGHYNCANDQIIYREYVTRNPRTLIGSRDLVFLMVWSSDSNIGQTDWMPC